MKLLNPSAIKKIILILMVCLNTTLGFSQNQNGFAQPTSKFWSKVQFGGGLGLSIGNGYTEFGIAPSAIYNFNEMVALGAGLQVSYVSSSGYYSSFLYGVNSVLLFNPIPQIQLSLGLSESRVNYENNEFGYENYSNNYWDTGLTIGAGYRAGNVTIGIGYNLIQNSHYDSEPIVPFVRAYF